MRHLFSIPASKDCFNEAGAKSAGKHRKFGRPISELKRASMRPAQKAPENLDP